MARWVTFALLVGGGWASLPLGAHAQSAGKDALGLPGIVRVGLPVSEPPGLTVAATAGYGLTEAQANDDGSHHRLSGVIGLGVRPVEWLGISLVLDGRYDIHPEDDDGPDDGAVGVPGLVARAGSSFGPLLLGAELGLRVPGEDAPSFALGALVLDFAALVGFAPEGSPFSLGARVGYRLDRSAAAIDDPDQLRRGDRLALGLSDFDALLVGLGATYRAGDIEVLAEATWDVLLGDGAPGASESPLRVDVGARVHLSDAAQLLLLAEVSPGGRPDVGPMQPLVPIEPRFSAFAGLRYTLPFQGEPAGGSTGDGSSDGSSGGGEEAGGVTLRGRIVDTNGQPIVGATVELRVGDRTFEATTDANGSYVFENVPEGPAQIRVGAEGFDESASEITVAPDARPDPIALAPTSQPGQLRGLVRDFTGSAVRATVTVQPTGTQVTTDADGLFEIDVPAGEYELVIESRGYATQRRRVVVQENGVTVLNADMRRTRR